MNVFIGFHVFDSSLKVLDGTVGIAIMQVGEYKNSNLSQFRVEDFTEPSQLTISFRFLTLLSSELVKLSQSLNTSCDGMFTKWDSPTEINLRQ